MLTTIKCLFLNPDGQPFSNNEVEIQLHKSGTSGDREGVYLPNLIISDTDEEGRCTLQLAPLPEKYSVLVQDRQTKATIYYEFYVPEVSPGVEVVLQDLFPSQQPEGVVWDERAVQEIAASRAELREANNQLRGTLVSVTEKVDSMDQVKADALAAQQLAQDTLVAVGETLLEVNTSKSEIQNLEASTRQYAEDALLSKQQAADSAIQAEASKKSASVTSSEVNQAKAAVDVLHGEILSNVDRAVTAAGSAEASVNQIGNSVREAKSARDVAVAAKTAAETINLQTTQHIGVVGQSIREVAEMRDTVLAEIEPISQLAANIDATAQLIASSKTSAELAATTAVAAKNEVNSRLDAAAQANTEARQSRDQAVGANTAAQQAASSAALSKDSALTSANEARQAKEEAESLNTAASDVLATVEELANNAITVGNQVIDASEDLLYARNEAVAAADQAKLDKDSVVLMKAAVERANTQAESAATRAAASQSVAREDRDYIEGVIAGAEILADSVEAAQSAVAANVQNMEGYASQAKSAATDAAQRAASVSAQLVNLNQQVATATTQKTEAANHRAAAELARNEAVAAKDRAELAASVVSGGLRDMGWIDLSTGAYPTPPEDVSGFWKVTVEGVVDGLEYGVGDTLMYSRTLNEFYKIDNTESVTSVNGKKGVVAITSADLNLDKVDNTSDLLKPLSNAVIEAIGQLIPLTRIQSNNLDSAIGKLLIQGAFGIGGKNENINVPDNNADTLTTTGIYRATSSTIGLPSESLWQLLHMGQGTNVAIQVAFKTGASAEIYIRTRNSSNTWINWLKVFPSDCLPLSGGVLTGKIEVPEITSKGSVTGLLNHSHGYLSLYPYNNSATHDDGGSRLRMYWSGPESRLVISRIGGTSTASVVVMASNFQGNFLGTATSANALANTQNVTIGGTTRSFNGTAGLAWSLADIGAAAASHTHSEYYLKAGGVLTGSITVNTSNASLYLQSGLTGARLWHNLSHYYHDIYVGNFTLRMGEPGSQVSPFIIRNTDYRAIFSGSVQAADGFIGNASTATALATARTINGVSFNGSANIEIPVIGVGQAPTDVTASRAFNTSYTNTTGKAIFVSVSYQRGGTTSVVGLVAGHPFSTSNFYGDIIYLIVPAGSTYRVNSTANTLTSWWEMR